LLLGSTFAGKQAVANIAIPNSTRSLSMLPSFPKAAATARAPEDPSRESPNFDLMQLGLGTSRGEHKNTTR
jgi:hypothetical protein